MTFAVVQIIECKLAANSEIKRKVIGQALEYGANMWKMTYNELDSIVRNRTNKTLADLMHETIQGEDWDEEAFRSNVESALETGSFILMIVVDEITEELSRIINFMNACGNPAFSFAALEMRRFQSDVTEMLVPRIVGDNRAFAPKPIRSSRKHWTEPKFFADAKARLTPESVAIIRKLYDWSLKMGRVGFGTGSGSGSFSFYSIEGRIPRRLRREDQFRYGYPVRLRRGSSFDAEVTVTHYWFKIRD